jgi:PTH2 family peptidyl-tRNA hydrolase
MVIVTRNNLTLSILKLAVQVAHAAVECALQTKKLKPTWFKKWKNEGGKKIVVRVQDLNDFYNLKKKADHVGIFSKIIEDAGHTEVPIGTKTTLGIGPAPNNLIDQVTGNLPLL